MTRSQEALIGARTIGERVRLAGCDVLVAQPLSPRPSAAILPVLSRVRLSIIVPSCAFGPCAWPTRCGAWRSCSRINRRTRSFEVRIPATRSFAQALRYPSPRSRDAAENTPDAWRSNGRHSSRRPPPGQRGAGLQLVHLRVQQVSISSSPILACSRRWSSSRASGARLFAWPAARNWSPTATSSYSIYSINTTRSIDSSNR